MLGTPAAAFPTGGPRVHLLRRMPPDLPEPSDKAAERHIIERYLGKRSPTTMSRWTAEFRDVLRREHRRRFQRYQLALGALVVIGLGALAYGYVQQRRVERAKRVAEDVFYSMKSLELAVSHLQLTAEERASYRTQRADLAARYREYLGDLGIYGPETPLEVQLIYRTAHLFGESEINIPRDFVQEVRRFIERWKGSSRLTGAMARAAEHGYGPRIAEIMLTNDMPPEFFYLALQESELRPDAVGPRTRSGIAKGMWQFMPATARAYGLQTGPLVGQPRPDPADDRQDFEKSTAAAARYLRDLYSTDAQASGLLVIAAYNWGGTNLLPLIRSLPRNPRERNFWQLLTKYRTQLPRETYNYVLAVVSAAVIGQDPRLFGFDFPPPVPSHVGDVAGSGS
jgi:membrane-bound lytic murein transglycosylase D